MRFIKNSLLIILASSLILINQTTIAQALENMKNVYNSQNKTHINQEIYSEIYCALSQFQDQVDISNYNLKKDYPITEIYKQVVYDHPEIFYRGISYSVSNNTLSKLYFTYEYNNHSKEDVKKMRLELDEKVDKIIKENINPSMSDIEKEVAIHDYLILNTEYDTDVDEDSHHTYKTLVKGKGVCQGYAESMNLILNKIGVKCKMITSDEMNHAWNIVEIDGEKYHIDVTRDDIDSPQDEIITYKYFNLNDEEIQKTHYWKYEDYSPCTSLRYLFMKDIIKSSKYKVDYLTGNDRLNTAINISQKGWDKSDAVVLVNESATSDILSATSFAKMKDAPILLTGTDNLNKYTEKEIERLGVNKVYIIGKEKCISSNIENILKNKGLEIEKLQGNTRYETSLAIAKEMVNINKIVVVNGENLTDAASIASISVSNDMPVILSSPREGIKIFEEYIKSKKINKSYIIGKSNEISKEIENNLQNPIRMDKEQINIMEIK